ncbi:hypothetical protein B0H14DRAFT_2697869 [Mycena olivaceomarginata]|nr:hypothetical protein B0H14DRAFT_2697869 [Mycena olivaceomarginata]
MPILRPSSSPPGFAQFPDESTNSKSSGSGPQTSVMPPGQDSVAEEKSSDAETPSTVSKFPLDVENISAEIAADLASALVGHVLFLKNQVPFPVVQLGRIPGGKSTPKALKLRTDLLASFDTLCSHLNTSFSSLSTALARVNGPGPRPTRRAYLAILVGPSIGSAKTKVMFAVDGLVTKVWGERDDVEEESDDESDDADGGDDSADEDGSEPSDTDSSTESDHDASSPPPSRSPSPSPCTSPSPPLVAASPPSSPPQKAPLRAPTRLLAHTLATAEHSMSAELAPSQTHILLRAPRQFTHPAWIPRQTASATLDGALREFREEAGDESVSAQPTQDRRKARTKAGKVEGVWVTCRSPGLEFPDDAGEESEMIWWSWDGKIVGFVDW